MERIEKIAQTLGAYISRDKALKDFNPPFYEFNEGEYRFLFHESSNDSIKFFGVLKGKKVSTIITYAFIETIGNARDFIVEKVKNLI